MSSLWVVATCAFFLKYWVIALATSLKCIGEPCFLITKKAKSRIPLALTFEEEDRPHSPNGFLPILREMESQRLITSSFLYFSFKSLTSSRKEVIKSLSNTNSSSESLEYSLRRAVLILSDNATSTCQRCLNSSSSFSRLNSSPMTRRK